jgi:hypothetical protein
MFMRTVFLCHARQDAQIATDIAQFLVRGTDVRFFVEDGAIDSPSDLMEKIREGQTADVILVLLTPRSSPLKWIREEWQTAIFAEPEAAGIPVGIVLGEECSFPALLRRKHFFNFSSNPLQAMRDMRRWLAGLGKEQHAPEGLPVLAQEACDIEPLVRRLVDAPGAEEASLSEAIALIHSYWRDFEEVHWLNCTARPFVSIAGELSAALRIHAQGELEENLDEIREHCASRRLLLVFDGIAKTLFTQISPGGRSSSIAIPAEHLRKTAGANKLLRAAAVCAPAGFRWKLVEEIAGKSGILDESHLLSLGLPGRFRMRKPALPEEPLVMPHARAVWNRYRGWVADEAGCLADLPDLEIAVERCLERASDAEAWTLACELSRAAYLLTRKQRRHAEAYHWMNQLSQIALRKADRAVLEESTREMRWILESWNRPAYMAAADARTQEQLSLF